MPGISTDNYSLEIAAYADAADIALVNRNTTKIDAIMADNRQISIDMYDSTLTYNTDDLAGHENAQNRIAVYRCLEDNVTGTWDSTKWVLTNLADEITGLRGGGGSGNVINTATGNPVEFTDGADAPFVGFTSVIQGSQSGSGTPSPENARPFVAYTQASATVADDDTDPTKTTTYTVSFSSYNPVYKGSVNYVNKSGIIEMWAVSLGSGSWTKYTESGGTFFSSYFPKDMKLSTEEYLCSHYAPKSGETLGDCEIEIKIRTGEPFDLVIIRDDSKSDMSYTQFETWLSTNGVKLAYTLSTPRTVDFTLDTVRALKGSNYITSTTGSLTVEYITEGYQPLVNPDDFVGATSSANGEHGLVPAPSISDREKYLKGDGTWGTITPGATTFAGLTDTDITNPTEGQAALYDETSGKWVNSDLPDADVTKEASGNPIELTDAASAPMVRCETEIVGSQDLHGYDKPWVGGAGKNKLPMTVSGIKALNTTGTWSGNAYTLNGVTFTIETDGDNNVTGIKVNGTANNTSILILGIFGEFLVNGSTYTFNGNPTNAQSYTQIQKSNGGGKVNTPNEFSMAYDSSDTDYYRWVIRCDNASVNNDTFYPMIRLFTVTDPTFSPYSNICPITAYTEGEIEVRGKNLFDKNDPDILTGRALDSSTGNVYIAANWSVSDYIGIEPSTKYTLSAMPTSQSSVAFYDSNKTCISGFSSFGTRETPSNAKYVRFDYKTEYADIMQLEKGETSTAYEPYKGTTHTTTYPSSIYRGSEDVVNGTETHDMLKKTFDGTESWTKYDTGQGTLFRYSVSGIKPGPLQTVAPNLLCSHYPTVANNARTNKTISQTQNGTAIDIIDNDYSDTTTFAAAMSGMEIAYELATPTTESITTTNLPIKSLSGYNHIESTTGDMEIEYFPAKEQPLIDLIPEASNMHEYSTAEHAVGTWVDSSTIYERSIDLGSFSIGSGGTYIIEEATDIDLLIDYDGYVIESSIMYALPDPSIRIKMESNKDLIFSGTANWDVTSGYLTIRYTKTSSNNRSLAKSAPQEEQVEELKEEPTEEIKEEPEEVKEEPVEEVKEEVKEEETKEEGEVNER